MKQCFTCKKIKELTDFGPRKDSKDGLTGECRICANKRSLANYHNSEQRREYARRWTRKNYRENREKMAARQKELRHQNIEHHRERQREWRIANPNKDRATAKKAKQKRRLYAENRVNASMSEAVRVCLRGGKSRRKWAAIVGYTPKELRHHIESLFTDGMTWDNYGKWHIDHIIPQSFFKFQSDDDVEFKMCWRIENLQPMWAVDNIRKGNKLIA